MSFSYHRAVLGLSLALSPLALAMTAASADLEPVRLPAVSAVNGKLELGAGWADFRGIDDDALFRGGASLSLPLGDLIGVQADVGFVNVFDETGVGGNLHIFTRDPGSYLLGAIAGYGDMGAADAFWVGPEAELYLNSVSLEMAAGYMNFDPDGGPSKDKAFVLGDIGFYATDNLRFTLGASSIAGFESGHVGAEWLMAETGLPLSFKADARFGEDHFTAITAGVSLYFGGEGKSLIRRHREDDPRNRVLDIFGSGAGAHGPTTPAVCVPAPENNYCEDVVDVVDVVE